MPDGTGTEIIEKLTSEGKKRSKVLFLSMHTSDEYIYYAIKSGGDGFVSKGITQAELLEAIKKLMLGENYFLGLSIEEREKIITKYELKESYKTKINHEVLSNRELEILTLIAEGFTSNEIADKIIISKRTVDNHRSNIMNKLELTSLPELLKYAIEFKYNNQFKF
jgi:two-component system response regulator NreC